MTPRFALTFHHLQNASAVISVISGPESDPLKKNAKKTGGDSRFQIPPLPLASLPHPAVVTISAPAEEIFLDFDIQMPHPLSQKHGQTYMARHAWPGMHGQACMARHA